MNYKKPGKSGKKKKKSKSAHGGGTSLASVSNSLTDSNLYDFDKFE